MQTTTNDVTTIIPAGINGFTLLAFPNKPVGKATIDNVVAYVQGNLLPVIGWKLEDGALQPLSIVPLPDDATHYLILPQGKIFNLRNPSERWATADQFYQHLLKQWRAVNPPPELVSVIPGRHAENVIHA